MPKHGEERTYIYGHNTTLSSDEARIETIQQDTTQRAKTTSSVDRELLAQLSSSPRGKTVTPPGKSKESEVSFSGALKTELGGSVQGVQENSQSSGGSTEASNSHNPQRHQLGAAPKLVSHRVNADRKIRKQIRNIQKAINQESTRNSSTVDSGILKGLRKALSKLTSPRPRSNNLPVSQSQSSWNQKSPPAKEFCAQEPPSQEAIQASTSPATQESPVAPEESLHRSITPIVEAHSPKPLGAASQELPVEAEPADASVSIPEEGTIMTEDSLPNGKKSKEGQEPIPVDHDMTEVATTEDDYLPLTKECHHYTRRSDVDWDIQKYWAQRYSIFSLYDEGIHMTDDSWFGVTPEPVANKVAEDLAGLTSTSKTVLIDMFAGAGGNVIAFALSKRWSTIIAIEKDPSVMACAQHNANIYGVFEEITWINDDSFSYLESNSSTIDPSKTVIFASPPWGGPGYMSDKIFNLNTMAPYSIQQIYNVCKGMDSALYLPRTSDLRQLAKLSPEDKKIEVVQYCMEGASKALVAYIPAITQGIQ